MMIPTKNLPLLLNTIYYAYSRALPPDGDFQPKADVNGGIITFCNRFVQTVLNGLNYGEMNDMTANEMVAFMSDTKNGWLTVDDPNAQAHANAGVIVIPGWSNPDGHGHVNLLIPGILEKSNSYGRAVPKCVNVGADVFFGKRISFAFGSDKQPQYFTLAAMV
jgi:hypothetical protein